MTMIEDHLFTVEVDIVKMDQDSDRVVINGYLGDSIETKYHDNHLLLKGSEASIRLHLSPEELLDLVQNITQ